MVVLHTQNIDIIFPDTNKSRRLRRNSNNVLTHLTGYKHEGDSFMIKKVLPNYMFPSLDRSVTEVLPDRCHPRGICQREERERIGEFRSYTASLAGAT